MLGLQVCATKYTNVSSNLDAALWKRNISLGIFCFPGDWERILQYSILMYSRNRLLKDRMYPHSPFSPELRFWAVPLPSIYSPSWVTVELNGGTAALGSVFWGGGPPAGGGPGGAPGWKVVGRGGFCKGSAEPMETWVFHVMYELKTKVSNNLY